MSDYFVGEIRLFAITYAPENFLPCDGRALSVSQYQTLFSLIGTTYGGDAQQFKLPDLRGRTPVSLGQGAGLSDYALGATAGATQVTLTLKTMPAHTHTASVSNQAATSVTPIAGGALGSVGANMLYANASQTGTTATLAPQTIQAAYPYPAAPAPHANIQPTIALQYCIAVNGIYPVPN